MNSSELNCNCDYCKKKLPFDLPDEIIDAINAGRLTVFAGAGISTENKTVFNETFYEDIFNDLNLEQDTDIDFPSLMSLYCNQPNGLLN